MIVAFTGHRLPKIGGYNIPNATYNYICQEIEKALIELKPDKAISGMAIGVDTIAAEICVKLKISFVAAVPFIGQEKIWPKSSQDIYRALLKKADEIVIVCDGDYAAYKMQVRNCWMVDKCDKLIAIYDGSSGGTGNCVKYAKQIGKPIHLIDPRKFDQT